MIYEADIKVRKEVLSLIGSIGALDPHLFKNIDNKNVKINQ